MEKEEINNEQTKRLDFAGKKLKTVGIAFISIVVVLIVTSIIISQNPEDTDLINSVAGFSAVIYGLLFIIIGAELHSGGKGLMGIFSENEK